MKAIIFNGPDASLTLEDIADPKPAAGELVIRVQRCGICGSDVHLTKEHGFFPVGGVIGHEFAGEVVAVGRGVEGFREGDIITAMPGAGCGECEPCRRFGPLTCIHGADMVAGGFAEYTRVKAATSIKLPASLTLADGALIEPMAVSLHGVRLANITSETRVVVLGTGAIGLAAIFWAKQAGAGRVVAASRSDRHAQLAQLMGAEAFVKTGDGEAQRVADVLGGAPQVVIECIGVEGALNQCIMMAQPGGTVVSLGFCTKPDVVVPALATYRHVSLAFSMAYSLDDFETVARTFDKGHVEARSMITETIPLAAVADTIEQLRAGRGDAKVQVDPWMNPTG
ncbi:zinc-binding dehydrogenase [uncultured Novosphingobium sp.]|uniref:zinc-dependent alcohol dehydrogenase n=1 Tax=uncultured Novosphingobium sp. TaxID=292277 RepID=UPI000737051D|nr:zinc-binding dehydrogenase [uncultured Novosphingobium sp.]KTR83508.1 alcohol dehydrogenase [Novosphingobium barchaimii]